MKIKIQDMEPLRKELNGKKVRKSLYRFGELEVGQGYEIPDHTDYMENGQRLVTVLLNRVRAAASVYSKRNNIKLSVKAFQRGTKSFIAIRRDA